MYIASRPMLIFVLELGYFLFVLHLGGTPLGAEIPSTAAATGLVAGLIAIPLVLLRSRRPSTRALVVLCVAGLMSASGCAALVMSSGTPASDGGMVTLGCVLVAAEFFGRRSPQT